MESTKSNGQWEVAEIQISYTPNVKPSERPRITGSRDAYEILKASWEEDKLQLLEQFKILLLNRANCMSIYEAFSSAFRSIRSNLLVTGSKFFFCYTWVNKI